METRSKILKMLEQLLKNKNIVFTDPGDDTALYQGGLGLDSLDTAEFSVLLEKDFGHDPYSNGIFPRTIGDVVAYYVSNAS